MKHAYHIYKFFLSGVMWLMMSEPLCLVVSVNAAYCALALVVQIIQSIVFGRLRPVERQHMKVCIIVDFAILHSVRKHANDSFHIYDIMSFVLHITTNCSLKV